MIYKGVLKRIIPFFLTFAAGLFIASFFVSVAAPNLNLRSGRSSHKYREIQRLRIENNELKEKNVRLCKELEELRRNTSNWDSEMSLPTIPPVDLDAPPPKAPRVSRRDR